MNDRQTADSAPATPVRDGASPSAAGLRRRRLLKIGAGAAPSALLLVGRPVHATYTCNTTSAWGSAPVNATGSVQARLEASALPVDGWTLSNWVNNTSQGTLGRPWDRLFGGSMIVPSTSNKKIVDAGVVLPKGTTEWTKLYAALNGGTNFQKYVLVALLNQKLLGGGSRSSCLPPTVLNDMAVFGTHTLASGKVWGETDIVNYLQANNLARP